MEPRNGVFMHELKGRKIQWLFAGFCFCMGLFLTVSAQAQVVPQWRLDAPAGSVMPRNFRMGADIMAVAGDEEDLVQGADWLRISGSGQPSEAGLAVLYERLRQETMVPLYLVDLRQESHGFFGGAAVSWHEEHNWGNRGQTASVAEKDEAARLQAAVHHSTEAVPMGVEDTAAIPEKLHGIVERAVTERTAAEKLGFHYVRIAATDQVWPEPQAVDAFLDFYKSLSDEPVWVHFHCQAGHGRTTIFMTMYDILRNPELPLEVIVRRQNLIGGTDGLAQSEKAAMLRSFYRYVQQNRADGFQMSWRTWLMQQDDSQ